MSIQQQHNPALAMRNTASFNKMKGYDWAADALYFLAEHFERLDPNAPREKVGYIDVLGNRASNRLMHPIGSYEDEFVSCEFYMDEAGCVVYWLNDRSIGMPRRFSSISPDWSSTKKTAGQSCSNSSSVSPACY